MSITVRTTHVSTYPNGGLSEKERMRPWILPSGHSVSEGGASRAEETHMPLIDLVPIDRLCPGKPLAENSIFIFISTLLSVFDISLPDEGELKPEFTMGLIRCD